MEAKMQKRDLKAHFEAILGHDLAEIGDGEIGLRYRVALWSQELETGNVSTREIGTSGESRLSCGKLSLFSVAAQTMTGEDGKADFMLSEYYCPPLGMVAQLPLIFVATPQSAQPVFVTASHLLIVPDAAPRDFRIQLYTWDAGGAPAKKISVDWYCQFPFFTVPIIS